MLCELIEPYKGSVYDGAMGSGGMFVQSMKFIEQHHGNRKNITVYKNRVKSILESQIEIAEDLDKIEI